MTRFCSVLLSMLAGFLIGVASLVILRPPPTVCVHGNLVLNTQSTGDGLDGRPYIRNSGAIHGELYLKFRNNDEFSNTISDNFGELATITGKLRIARNDDWLQYTELVVDEFNLK